MKVQELLQALVNSAEKGANIARVIRSEEALLELLVQEKKGDQKNPRFVQDFKTLADVLVQEMMKHDLSEKFPGIGENIYGEESNKFTNVLGETVTVEIKENQNETSALLSKVLDDNERAAQLLASVVHETVSSDAGPNLQSLGPLDLDVSDIGVWIDPIDSTAQYIEGAHGKVGEHGMVESGLQCVVVLVGVYHKQSGLPLIGVANQPFSKLVDSRWHGESMWGVCIDQNEVFSVPNSCSTNSTDSREANCPESRQKFSALMSHSEKMEIQELFRSHMTINHAAGAGYKLLNVIQGHSDAYILSKGSTFKWDTCGPHAILLAMGGGIVSFKSLDDLVKSEGNPGSHESLKHQLRYDKADNASLTGASKWSNSQGLIAYRCIEDLLRILHIYSGKIKT